jgi:hypothetical protein
MKPRLPRRHVYTPNCAGGCSGTTRLCAWQVENDPKPVFRAMSGTLAILGLIRSTAYAESPSQEPQFRTGTDFGCKAADYRCLPGQRGIKLKRTELVR